MKVLLRSEMTVIRRVFAVVVLFFMALWNRVEGQSSELLQDGKALQAFLDGFLPGIGYNASENPCQVNGVTCQNDVRITSLDFSGSPKSTGIITAGSLSNLTGLTDLNLSGTNLSRLDTADLRNLAQLARLNLSSNSIDTVAVLEAVLALPLDSMDLSRNPTGGSLPLELAGFTKLRILNLSGNKLNGTVPVWVGKLATLRQLDLADNEFDGEVLNVINQGPLGKLEDLNLSGNRYFTGSLTAQIQNLKELRLVDLSKNAFSGPIPIQIGDLRKLEKLNLAGNNFDSSIPSEVENLQTLSSLDISRNKFSGQVPLGILKCTALLSLNLSWNLLNNSNNFLSQVFQLPELKTLDLSFNAFTGSLDGVQLSRSKLETINLESCGISGNFSNLLALPTIQSLNLAGNNISGPLPAQITGLFRELDLHNNSLSGKLPQFGSNFSKLNLHSNKFSGELPSVPGNLRVLDIHNNALEGFVPNLSKILTLEYLDLSSNKFSGDIPGDLQGLNLTTLGLADNKFVKYKFPELPRGLNFVNLSRTNLFGGIPATIGDLVEITHLDLSSNNLTGEIPREMWKMENLAYLNLSTNSLDGEIPHDLVKLFSLSDLDLTSNNLSGPIPAENQWLLVNASRFDGNPGLCRNGTGLQARLLEGIRLCNDGRFSPSPTADGEKAEKKTALIIGLTSALAIALLALGLCVYCRVSMAVKPLMKDELGHLSGPMSFEKDAEIWAKGVKDPSSIPVIMFEKPLLSLSFADLLVATANFNKELQIADGGYGPVYKGILADTTQLAIKVLVDVQFNDEKDATARIEALARVKHSNLVALAGYCLVGSDSLLIHEYMVNGDLQRWLHELPEGTRNPEDWSRDTWEQLEGDEMSGDFLSWPTRHKIALGAARALAFLHHGCSPPVVHRDLKSSNILLDESFEAHIVDSGLAGMAKVSGTPVIGGTLGYVPPEYGQTWQATPRGDVYSFGVVLLELVTGRKPTGNYFHDSSGGNLVGWVRLLMKDRRELKALDSKLASQGDVTQMLEVLRIGYLCTAEIPAKRPTMQQVVGLLKDCQPGS